MIYAPVLIPTLNRWQHFQRCVESLSRCTHADKTVLYVALDYPLKEEHWEGYKKNSEYVETIRGFKDVVVIRRSENYGFMRNNDEAEEQVFRLYDRIIETDDDNVFSINFLIYINRGLDRFEDDPRIMAICGHNGIEHDVKDYSANFIYRKGFSAWGFGTWKDRLGKQTYTPDEILLFLSDPILRKTLIHYSERNFYSLMQYYIYDQPIWGDGALGINMIKNGTYSVYPTISKVRNLGHDGSGVHAGNLEDSPYMKVKLDISEDFDFAGEPDFDDPNEMILLKDRKVFSPMRKLKFWMRSVQKPKKTLNLLRALYLPGKKKIDS